MTCGAGLADNECERIGGEMSDELEKLMSMAEWRSLSAESRHKLNVYFAARDRERDEAVAAALEAAARIAEESPHATWHLIAKQIRALTPADIRPAKHEINEACSTVNRLGASHGIWVCTCGWRGGDWLEHKRLSDASTPADIQRSGAEPKVSE